jgi:hypothetical protein
MACPIAPVLVLGAVAGGGHTLYVQDREHRLTSWLTSLALLGGWALYLWVFRHAPVRITLEVLSVLALVAGGVRVWWLMRTRQMASPLWASAHRGVLALWAVFGDRAVLAAKIWLLAMVTMQWRGLVRFSGGEYAAVSGVLALLVALRVYRLARLGRRSRAPFAALESFAAGAAGPACPLGFGCVPGSDTPPPGAARGDVSAGGRP